MGGWFGMGKGKGKERGSHDENDDSVVERPEAWNPTSEIAAMSKAELISKKNEAESEMARLLTGQGENIAENRWRIRDLKLFIHRINTALQRFEGEEERRAS